MMTDTPRTRPTQDDDTEHAPRIDALKQLQALQDLDADRLALAQRGQRGHAAMLLPFAVLGFIVIMLYWPFGLMFGGYIDMTWAMLFAFLAFAILSIIGMLLLMHRYQRQTGMATYFGGGKGSRRASLKAWHNRGYAATYALVIVTEIGIPWLNMAWGYHGGSWPVAALIALAGSIVIYLLLQSNMRIFFRTLASPSSPELHDDTTPMTGMKDAAAPRSAPRNPSTSPAGDPS
ncbi:hypothetical protein [Bifidobacterium simiarum]|uniref:Uncharacterized protein n=1 Tax=Bifidobacterium simiarum TaxID=2045441 RepID=A0A2M9HH85_9BIFI|nr:hypothetical protein [Bifidobacterium simiarum]PJM76184.1 hypothetical protein CSQ87_01310 [Bifidobacterium simiarum]